MNPDTLKRIFELGMKGIGFIQQAAQNGEDIMPAVTALKKIFSKRPQDVTPQELDETEKVLDAQIAKFNEELPEEK